MILLRSGPATLLVFTLLSSFHALAADGTDFAFGGLRAILPKHWTQQHVRKGAHEVRVLRSADAPSTALVVFDVIPRHEPVEDVLTAFINAAAAGSKVMYRVPMQPDVASNRDLKAATQSVCVLDASERYAYQVWHAYEVAGGRQVAVLESRDERELDRTRRLLAHVLDTFNSPRIVKVEKRSEVVDPGSPNRVLAPDRGSTPNGYSCFSSSQCASGFCYMSTCGVAGASHTFETRNPARLMLRYDQR